MALQAHAIDFAFYGAEPPPASTHCFDWCFSFWHVKCRNIFLTYLIFPRDVVQELFPSNFHIIASLQTTFFISYCIHI
jgi:hypothetical protein